MDASTVKVFVLAACAFPLVAVARPTMALAKDRPAHTGVFKAEDGGLAEANVDAAVTWDDAGLHVRIVREIRPGESLRVRGVQEDAETIFRGVAVEAFFAPHPEAPEVFYQIGVNPSNVVYLARRFDKNWRPKRPISTRTTITADRWWADITIPSGAFGEKQIAEGTVWMADFSSGSFDWAGVPRRHDPSVYGELRFGGLPQRAYVERLERGKDGTLHVTYAVSPARCQGEIPHKCGCRQDLGLVSGDERLAEFSIAEGHGDTAYLTLDRYYYDASEPVSLVFSAKGFSASTVRVRRLETDELVFSADSHGSGELALGNLHPGEYAFEISDVQCHASCQFEVVKKVASLRSEAVDGSLRTFAGDHRLLAADFADRRGVPFYPVTGSIMFSGAIGFRQACPYKSVEKPADGYLFDSTRTLFGAGAILDAGAGKGLMLNRLAYEAQLSTLVKREAAGNPEVQTSSASFYQSLYRALKERYPHLLFSIHIDTTRQAGEFAEACDVFEQADWRCSYSADPLRTIRSAVDAVRAVTPQKPAIFWIGASIPDCGKFRTADELNTAVRYCILRGMAGNVFHMGHGGVPVARTRLWSFIRGCESEVNGWYPQWACGREIDVGLEACEGVVAGARRGRDGFVLIAANLSPYERTFSYADPVSGCRHRVRLTGSGSIVINSSESTKGR